MKVNVKESGRMRKDSRGFWCGRFCGRRPSVVCEVLSH